MEGVVVDCASGASAAVALTDAQAQQVREQQQQIQHEMQASAQEAAFAAQQRTALAACAASLQGTGAADDAAALAGLVHKLVATPPQPLSAPEVCALARFVLRCLLARA